MLKNFLGCIREYKKQTIITPLLMIGEVSCECVIPMITASLINSINSTGTSGGQDVMDVIIKDGIILIVMAFVSLMFGALAGKSCATASAGFAKNLRHDLFSKVQSFSFANIDKFSTSSLVTRLTTDVANVQMSFMMIIRTAVRAPLMLIVASVMSAKVGRSLAWTFAAIIPFMAVSLIIIAIKAMPLFRSVFKKYDNLNSSVQENIKGIRVVKSFVRENHEKKKFADASEDVCRDFTRAEKILAFNGPIMQAAMNGSMLIIAFFAAKLIINSLGEYIDIGSLSSMITYSMQILMSLVMLSMIFVIMTMSVASAKRIIEVLEEDSDITEPQNALTTVADGSIDYNNVSFKYSKHAKKYALANINLHIKNGETVGIIGGTGVGKSSLIQLICRLYDVNEGSVCVGGKDVRSYSLDTLRNEVAVVLQKNVLFSGTIAENLRWGNPDATDEELRHACRLARADEFIESFPDKYDTHIEQGGTNVSGGQKQRLCIARALLKKPKVLILDDSTSAVDTRTDLLIREAFKNEIPDTTKIIIAQRISSVQDADKIVVMDNGTIVDEGTHEQLIERSEIYKEVYFSQNKAGEQNA